MEVGGSMARMFGLSSGLKDGQTVNARRELDRTFQGRTSYINSGSSVSFSHQYLQGRAILSSVSPRSRNSLISISKLAKDIPTPNMILPQLSVDDLIYFLFIFGWIVCNIAYHYIVYNLVSRCAAGIHYLWKAYILDKFYSAAPSEFPARPTLSLQIYQDPTTCAKILACARIDDDMGDNHLPPVVSRAIPNGRLISALGIDNAFTTTDGDYRTRFVDEAIARLEKLHDLEWGEMVQAAVELVDHQIIQAFNEDTPKIALVPLIQSLSLKISLKVLFDKDPLKLDDQLVLSLAKTINALWIQSKKSALNEADIEDLRQNLYKCLESLFPGRSLAPRETPMNFIIPIYETLWRVVLHGFIEVAFRHPSSSDVWRQVLTSYTSDPTAKTFLQTYRLTTEKLISADFLAKEALRLYPPTKRIYRTYQCSSDPEELTEVAADIEQLHRDPKHWGDDSHMYVPTRWTTVSQKVKSTCYFPFGGPRMMCPAKGKFGPRMVALLIAVVVAAFGTGMWELEDEEGSLAVVLDLNEPLESSRQAHSSLYLRLAEDFQQKWEQEREQKKEEEQKKKEEEEEEEKEEEEERRKTDKKIQNLFDKFDRLMIVLRDQETTRCPDFQICQLEDLLRQIRDLLEFRFK